MSSIYALFESKYKNNLLNRYKVMSATSSAQVISPIRLQFITLLNHFEIENGVMMTSRTSLDLIVDMNLTQRLLISILEIKNIIIITHSTLANWNPPEILTSMLLSKVSSIMKNSNDVNIQLNCNHGLPSENSPKFSHLPDAVWFFDDITWYWKHFRCSSLEYVRWFWSMGWLLGKKRYKLDET